MANEEQQHGAVSIGEVINGQIATKIDYLQQLQNAIADHDDCQVYQLLDNQRYAAEIEHREQQPNDSRVMNLVDNLADQLSNYLSSNLIKYLGKAYPSFTMKNTRPATTGFTLGTGGTVASSGSWTC